MAILRYEEINSIESENVCPAVKKKKSNSHTSEQAILYGDGHYKQQTHCSLSLNFCYFNYFNFLQMANFRVFRQSITQYSTIKRPLFISFEQESSCSSMKKYSKSQEMISLPYIYCSKKSFALPNFYQNL